MVEEATMPVDLIERFRQAPLPFARMLGIEVVAASEERIVAAMKVTEQLCTTPAVLHGGALGTIANLDSASGTVTIESKTNFIRPAPLGHRVIGEAIPIHRGRRIMVWQTRITLEDSTVVALTTQTQLVIPAKLA
jgi:1,4-dihydroxy-2-naphthoyl-CoA hydrolase